MFAYNNSLLWIPAGRLQNAPQNFEVTAELSRVGSGRRRAARPSVSLLAAKVVKPDSPKVTWEGRGRDWMFTGIGTLLALQQGMEERLQMLSSWQIWSGAIGSS